MESLSKVNKKNSTVILVLLHIFIIGLISVLFIRFSQKKCQTIKNSAKSVEISEQMKPGNTGEVMVKNNETGKEESLVTSTMPLVIFDTTGKILEVKNDRIIVKGDGFSFADEQPRDLTIIFIDSTLTLGKDQTQRYEGLSGLKYLKAGMEIIIDSDSNIRGKTEFDARTVKIL